MYFDVGTLIQIFLRTNNYHRYHSAVGGYAAQIDQIGGFQYWMPEQERQEKDLYYKWLTNNCRRGLLYVDTGKFGLVAHNYVGVWLVNSVNINIDAGQSINKGDETGYFHYGGSTIAVLFQKNALLNITVDIGDDVQFGERLAIANMNFYQDQNDKKDL